MEGIFKKFSLVQSITHEASLLDIKLLSFEQGLALHVFYHGVGSALANDKLLDRELLKYELSV